MLMDALLVLMSLQLWQRACKGSLLCVMLADPIRSLEACSGECRELIDEPPKHRSGSTFRRFETSILLPPSLRIARSWD